MQSSLLKAALADARQLDEESAALRAAGQERDKAIRAATSQRDGAVRFLNQQLHRWGTQGQGGAGEMSGGQRA